MLSLIQVEACQLTHLLNPVRAFRSMEHRLIAIRTSAAVDSALIVIVTGWEILFSGNRADMKNERTEILRSSSYVLSCILIKAVRSWARIHFWVMYDSRQDDPHLRLKAIVGNNIKSKFEKDIPVPQTRSGGKWAQVAIYMNYAYQHSLGRSRVSFPSRRYSYCSLLDNSVKTWGVRLDKGTLTAPDSGRVETEKHRAELWVDFGQMKVTYVCTRAPVTP